MMRAILFDLGNTLVGYYRRAEFPAILGQAIKEVRDYLAGRDLLRLDPEAISERVGCEDHENADGRVRPLEDRLVRIFGIDDALEARPIVDEMCRRFMRPIFAKAEVYEDTAPVLNTLRQQGIKTAVISNTPWGSGADLWRQELGRHQLSKRLNDAIFCRDVGWRKPARQLFDFALARLDVAPQECLFVGDDPRWDLEGASRAGIPAMLIDRRPSREHIGENGIRRLYDLLDWLDFRQAEE